MNANSSVVFQTNLPFGEVGCGSGRLGAFSDEATTFQCLAQLNGKGSNYLPVVIAFVVVAVFGLTRSAAAEDLRVIAEGHKFTEGPAVAPDGVIYFTDQPNDRIQRILQDGSLETFLQPAGRSNGLYFGPDGRLIACADGDNELWAIDLDSREHEVLVRRPG
ncbi:MAG: hypothetical protein AAF664_05775, partial [Planctomycetota bacterium]